MGRAHPGVDLALRDLDHRRRPVADGEVGEVCLRSPAVMSGYWRDPEATAAAFWPDGFVRTGDLGQLDDQGRLRLVGRAKEMYVRGGYNVLPDGGRGRAGRPSRRWPRWRWSGVADDVMGEIGVAVVAPRRRTPPRRPSRSCAPSPAERLAHHKLPERLRLVDQLPLTPMEKVDKRALAASL